MQTTLGRFGFLQPNDGDVPYHETGQQRQASDRFAEEREEIDRAVEEDAARKQAAKRKPGCPRRQPATDQDRS